MSLNKINFANKIVEVFTVVDKNGVKWHQANPFAEALGYNNPYKAIRDHVTQENVKEYLEIGSDQNGRTG
ncbi:BRO-D [Urbanus proteus nucleopolyhedrovirus]|uniref:BRO-D n=1 Tax=Urbanus proteus nucleopolyhedrovirus TaxID=1675866 RepID=A0A162GUR2_9ABAC|nr:BRO-D [Urbanus proteus nucleopolyhedrovirus]AKR17364.1 BRO-D [Urbanus proteus nucleopolyhedrovirus]